MFAVGKENHHGPSRTSQHFNARESQRHDRPRRGSRQNDQAGDPRYGETIPAGENASGGFHRGPAHAREKAEGKRRYRERLDAQGGARRRQRRGRPGARGARSLPDFVAAGAKLPRTGRRSESASGNVERRLAETGAEIGRSKVKA